jgi:hypothetical protein
VKIEEASSVGQQVNGGWIQIEDKPEKSFRSKEKMRFFFKQFWFCVLKF